MVWVWVWVWGRLLLLLLALLAFRVYGQIDYSSGFISIDCGLPARSTIIESGTKLTYISDEQFIDTGVNSKINSQYINGDLRTELVTLRSFPDETRNCYTLKSKAGSKYLLRAAFKYGNYDNLNKPPIFDIYLGGNLWDTVNITAEDDFYLTEIITVANADNLQVCLINKKQGTPFISWLDLRPLDLSTYQFANSTQSLVNFFRLNIGASPSLLRYPDDPYDRFWFNYTKDTWTDVSTRSTVKPDTDFATPSLVMQTASTSSSTNESIDISWSTTLKSIMYYVVLHIAEIQSIVSPDHREFDIFSNGELLWDSNVLDTLHTGSATYTSTGYTDFNMSLKANSNSTLPPILNAIEVYMVVPAGGVPTYGGDVAALNAIKENYKVNKGWNGDPCLPSEYTWTGVTCTSDSSNIPRITGLNLSASGLTGIVVSSFGNLSALKSLDLSGNDLSGFLPTVLDDLSALTYLDLSGNSKISTTLPPGLQKKQQAGTLTYKSGNSAQPSKKKKIPVVIIAVVVAVAVLLLLVAAIILVLCLRKNNQGQINIPKPIESYGSTPLANHTGNYANSPQAYSPYATTTNQNYANIPNGAGEGMLNFENRQFTYNEIAGITNNFQNNIGTGGFGSVYVGNLENGTKVAVKMRSHSSSQGVKEFLAEAQNLTRVHHRNLVSLLGYCLDGECTALVYEYMQEGTLQDKLRDYGRPLSWKQRLQIAYESALGLEYLHKACNPPLVHRDVKTNNILLNANLEAKIADFGLSRAFNDASTHVSTAVVGTPGYLDPEYYTSYQLSEKSDVFSFGVVLFEVITGKPPILPGPDGGHVAKWVSQKLTRGDIESIVDPVMQGQYDINSVWKVTELARKCTAPTSAQRPTMSSIAAELKESLELEISTGHSRSGNNTTYTNPPNYSRNDNYVSDVSQNSNFEMAYMQDIPAPGPTAR